MKSDWSTQLTYKSMALAMIAVFVLPIASVMAQDNDSQNETTKKKRGPKTHRVSKTIGPAEGYKPVEMFAAMKAGKIKVELIPKDATQSSIFVTNNTEEPLSVEMPASVILEVTATEPGVKGNTATNATKPATVETGARINVPLFINEGDKIRIDTEKKIYTERIKE